jgi:hypothetical protein
VNRTGIYGQAIKRTFADLYGVSPDAVDVSWTTGKTIVVHCAGKTFLHPILSDPDDDAPQLSKPLLPNIEQSFYALKGESHEKCSLRLRQRQRWQSHSDRRDAGPS